MSVFYNLEKCNSKGEGEMELRFAENSFEEILDRQDKYEVAVNRFKIPVQNVDLFRLYPNRYYYTGYPATIEEEEEEEDEE